jgi:hypothetical protein
MENEKMGKELENFESDKDSISCNGSLLAFKTLPYPLN